MRKTSLKTHYKCYLFLVYRIQYTNMNSISTITGRRIDVFTNISRRQRRVCTVRRSW